jgi:hypothetical protein
MRVSAPRKTSRLHYLLIGIYLLLPFFYAAQSQGCECPLTTLSLEECDKYELIFRGKVISVNACDNKPGEATFEIEELYKGNVTKKFKVLFECNTACAAGFSPGDEWIIYSRYKQIENAMMDWCSRSRKYFKIDKLDFYTDTYGNDYDDELKFLRKKLGLHRLLADNPTRAENRNPVPNTNQLVIILLSSLAAVVLFYYVFNKFFR